MSGNEQRRIEVLEDRVLILSRELNAANDQIAVLQRTMRNALHFVIKAKFELGKEGNNE